MPAATFPFVRFPYAHFPYMLALPCLLLIAGCNEPPPAGQREIVQPAKVLTIGAGAGRDARRFPGTVRAAQRVDLAFQVAGQLIEFPVKEGQSIRQGQRLGQLDKRDYQSNFDAAIAQRVKLAANLKRADELIDKKFISDAEYDRIKADYDIAVSNVEKQQKALEDTELTAPFAGTIAKTYVDNFQDVNAKQPIISLQDNSALEVVVNIAESLIVRRQESDRLQLLVKFDSIPEAGFVARIKEFATEADPQTQTYRYILAMEGIEGYNLLPGMTASVEATRLNTQGGSAVVQVPVAALANDGKNQISVWVVDDNNQVHRRQVVTGELRGEASIQILSGLNQGDRIVTAGVHAMREGRTINPIDEVVY